jgi:hypothetical protein
MIDVKVEMHLKNITKHSMEERIIIFMSVICGMYSLEQIFFVVLTLFIHEIYLNKSYNCLKMLSMVKILKIHVTHFTEN